MESPLYLNFKDITRETSRVRRDWQKKLQYLASILALWRSEFLSTLLSSKRGLFVPLINHQRTIPHPTLSRWFPAIHLLLTSGTMRLYLFFILQTRMCVMIDCRRQKRWRMASPGTSKTWLNSTGELIGLCFMTSSSLFVSRDDNGNLFESRGSTTVVMPNATTLDNLPSLQQQPCNPICNASDFFDCLSQGSWGKF